MYDLGGGTLDLAVVTTLPAGFDVIDFKGYIDVGGTAFDEALFLHAGSRWGRDHTAVAE